VSTREHQTNASPRKSRRRRLALLVALAVIILPVAVVGLTNWLIVRAARPHILPLDALPECQVAIVLGAGVWRDGTPSSILRDRLDAGIELYRAGRVRKLLLSGDHGQKHYDEVNAMRRHILAAGVPAGDVFLDHAGFSTYESMYRAREVFRVRRAIVVTQRFHLARAVYTARQLGLDAWGYAADRRRYAAAARNALRETLARCKAAFDVLLLEPRPRFLGSPHPITGSGLSTWDTGKPGT